MTKHAATPPTDRRLTAAVAAVAIGLVGVAQIAAQPRARVVDAPAPDALPGAPADDPTAGVFVRDSATAADKLALAQRMEKAQEWDTSADVYQEVLDRFGDRVVPTHHDAQGRADRYGSVGAVVQDRLAAWPAAGMRVYVARHAAAARQMLDAAPDDAATLARVVSRYFLTDAGRDAAIALAELSFDRGEFAASATLCDRLIDHHPNLDASAADGAPPMRPLLLARSAIAWRLAGEPSRAAARGKTLAEQFADARATIGGRADAPIAEVVAAELARPMPTGAARSVPAVAAGSWPQPFGSADRAAVAPEPAGVDVRATHEWARLLTFPVDRGNAERGPGDIARQQSDLFRTQRERGAATGILPSVDAGVLYFQDNVALQARDLATGEPPAGWLATYPNDAGRFRVAGATPTPRGAQMTVTLTDRCALAILGQDDSLGRAVSGDGVGGPRVVCLDRTTGKLLWQASPSMNGAAAAAGNVDPNALARRMRDARRRAQPRGIDGPVRAAPADVEPMPAAGDADNDPQQPGAANRAAEAAAAVRATAPCGSVLVVGDLCYVVTRGSRTGGFQDVYLCAFNLADGAMRWASHLASGNPPLQSNFEDAPTVGDVPDSHLAYADGRVVVSTDLGAIASVDALDGTIGWLALYPRPRGGVANPNFGGQMMNPDLAGNGRVSAAYAGNPVILHDGKVVALPVDAEHLVVHDAATGRQLVRVPMRRRSAGGGQRAERIDVLAGLAGDRLVCASAWAVAVLDWAKLRDAANTVAATPDDGSEARLVSLEDALVNHRAVISPRYPDQPIRGRPFLSDGSLYVSTAQRLYRFTADARRVLDRYPSGEEDLDARPDESPGNVVVVDGNVIVAGPDRVAVYAELALLRRRLDAAIAADPRAVPPRLAYAQAMFDTDRRDEALRWIDAAIATITADGMPTPGPSRDRVFDACMAMLRRLDAAPRDAGEGDADARVSLGAAAAAAARAEQPIAPEARPFAAALVDRLAKLADTPRQQVAARLAGAAVARRSGDAAGAVDAYQSLIEEPAWATMSVRAEQDDADAPATRAVPLRTLARGAIDAIVARDASAYARVEARAKAALDAEQAKGGASLSGLFAIVDRYPNAAASRDAMALAAERVAAAAASDATPAVADLRRLGAQLGDEPQRRATLERTLYTLAMARGDTQAALGRARRVAQLGGGELPLAPATTQPADTSASAVAPASQVVQKLQKAVFDAAERALPDIGADFANVPSFATDRVVAVERIASILVPVPGRGDARNDRVLAIRRGDRKLLVFKPGATEPAAEIDVPGLIDVAAATWDGNRVYLSQPGRVTCVDAAKGSVLWSRDASSLGGGGNVADDATDNAPRGEADVVEIARSLAPAGVDLEPAPAAAAPGEDEMSREERRLEQMLARANNPDMVRAILIQQNQMRQRRMLIRNQQIQIQQRAINGRLRGIEVIDGADPAANWTVDPANASGTEAIAQVRVAPGADALIVTTTRGRVLALGRADGQTRWRARLGTDRSPATAEVVGGDQVVLVGTDERASRLLVLDAATGRESLRREYASSDVRQRIVNVAVTPEGFVATVHADGVNVWDLGDGSPEPIGTWRSGGSGNGDDGMPMPFALSRAPEHVAICGDRLLVVAGLMPPSVGPGAPPPQVRVFDLLTAQPVRRADPAAAGGNANAGGGDLRIVPTYAGDRRNGDEPIGLRVHRDRVLINTGQALASYAVLDAQPAWSRALPDQPTSLTPQGPILVRGGLLIVGWPGERVGETSAQATLELYSRETLPNGREVGMAVDELLLGQLAGTNAGPESRRTRRQPDGPRLTDRFAAVDGGVYFLTNNGRLTFLPGAKR